MVPNQAVAGIWFHNVTNGPTSSLGQRDEEMGYVSVTTENRLNASTFGEVLNTAADRHPEREALVFPHARLTFDELRCRAQTAARAMIGLGLRQGDVVGILMPSCVDNVVTLFGAALAGLTCVPINSRFREHELDYIIRDAEMRALFTSDIIDQHVDFVDRLHRTFPDLALSEPGATPAISSAPQLSDLVLLGDREANGMLGRGAFDAKAAGIDEFTAATRQRAVIGDDTALMLYTSGTTSMPKGCPLKHRQLVGISRQIGERLGIRDGDRLWDALPLFHASSLLPLLAAFQFDSTFFSQVHFDPDEAVSILIDEHATLAWPAYATIWQPILTAPSFDAAALSHLRAILCVGPGETLRMMEESLPQAPVVGCYGITEGSGVPTMCNVTDCRELRTDTCGLPFEGVDAVIRDPESRRPLPAGERGLLWLHGEYVIDGYWKDPAKTAEAFDSEHWFCTGDLASVDETGRVRFHGRIKDTLKVGGENVAAVELEAFLTTHPAVKLAAVVGVPDQKYGQVPAAFIELRPDSIATEQELIAFCRGSIASFKVPRYVRFVAEWPMSATKVRKDDLRTPLLAELGIDEPNS